MRRGGRKFRITRNQSLPQSSCNRSRRHDAQTRDSIACWPRASTPQRFSISATAAALSRDRSASDYVAHDGHRRKARRCPNRTASTADHSPHLSLATSFGEAEEADRLGVDGMRRTRTTTTAAPTVWRTTRRPSTGPSKGTDLPPTSHFTSPSTFTGEAKGGREVVSGGDAGTTMTAPTMPKK